MHPAATSPPAPRTAGPAPDAGLGARLSKYLKEAKGAFSDNTERAVRSDVGIFTDWCGQRGLSALPARTDTVVAFIDAMAQVRAPATVRRYVFSIATLHKAAQLTSPLKRTGVKLALQRMHRKRGRRQAQAQGLTWPLRQRMLNACGARLIDDRNRALLAVAYDTLLRRSELVALKSRTCWWRWTARARCGCSAARPILQGKARCSIWLQTRFSWCRDGLNEAVWYLWTPVPLAAQGREGRRNSMTARCRASSRAWPRLRIWETTSWKACPGTVHGWGRPRT